MALARVATAIHHVEDGSYCKKRKSWIQPFATWFCRTADLQLVKEFLTSLLRTRTVPHKFLVLLGLESTLAMENRRKV